MTGKELLDTIRAAVRDIATKGVAAVSLVDLDRYLASLETAVAVPPQPPTPEMIQAQIALHRSSVDEGLEMFRSVIGAGQDARQSSLWINGGAAVALLALVGHVVATDEKGAASIVARLAWPLALYVAGVLLAAMSSGATYAAQVRWSEFRDKSGPEAEPYRLAGSRWNRTAIVLVLSSYGLFAVASLLAFAVFHGLSTTSSS